MPTTLQNIIDLSRQESNMENNFFVTDAELITYINNSLSELDDMMINEVNEDYRVQQYITVLQGGNFTIPTMAETMKIRGIDIQGQGLNSAQGGVPWNPLPKFQLIDRGRLNNNVITRTYPYGKTNLSYFWQGNQGIIIYPEVQAAGTYRVWWIPKFQPLIFPTDVMAVQMDMQAWVEYAVVDVCIKILTKQNLDPSAFMQRKEALRQRIIGAMTNRDESGPDVIANVRGNGWGSGSNGGWGWGGNFGGY